MQLFYAETRVDFSGEEEFPEVKISFQVSTACFSIPLVFIELIKVFPCIIFSFERTIKVNNQSRVNSQFFNGCDEYFTALMNEYSLILAMDGEPHPL